jgi:uncharacterized RDD family membrane protein YckC
MQNTRTLAFSQPSVGTQGVDIPKRRRSMTAESDPASVPKAAPAGYRYAGAWIRFGALVIDNVLILVVLFGLAAVLVTAIAHSALANAELNVRATRAVVAGVTSGAWLCWLAGWQATIGQTPGMRLLGLRVRGPSGEAKPSLVAAVIRNFLTILPGAFWGAAQLAADTDIQMVHAIAVCVVYWVIGVSISWSPTRQGIHDRLAGGTYVVRRGTDQAQKLGIRSELGWSHNSPRNHRRPTGQSVDTS